MFPKLKGFNNISRPDRWARQCRSRTCSGRCRFAEKNFWEILDASSTRWSTSCKPTVSFLTESGNKNLHIILFPLDQYFISRLQAWTKIVLLLNLLVILRLTNFFKCNLCFSGLSFSIKFDLHICYLTRLNIFFRISCSDVGAKGKRVSVLSTNGNGSLRENIVDVFGPKQIQNLDEIRWDLGNDFTFTISSLFFKTAYGMYSTALQKIWDSSYSR